LESSLSWEFISMSESHARGVFDPFFREALRRAARDGQPIELGDGTSPPALPGGPAALPDPRETLDDGLGSTDTDPAPGLQTAPLSVAIPAWLLTHGMDAAPWLGLAILAAGLVTTLWPWRSALRLRGLRLAGLAALCVATAWGMVREFQPADLMHLGWLLPLLAMLGPGGSRVPAGVLQALGVPLDQLPEQVEQVGRDAVIATLARHFQDHPHQIPDTLTWIDTVVPESEDGLVRIQTPQDAASETLEHLVATLAAEAIARQPSVPMARRVWETLIHRQVPRRSLLRGMVGAAVQLLLNPSGGLEILAESTRRVVPAHHPRMRITQAVAKSSENVFRAVYPHLQEIPVEQWDILLGDDQDYRLHVDGFETSEAPLVEVLKSEIRGRIEAALDAELRSSVRIADPRTQVSAELWREYDMKERSRRFIIDHLKKGAWPTEQEAGQYVGRVVAEGLQWIQQQCERFAQKEQEPSEQRDRPRRDNKDPFEALIEWIDVEQFDREERVQSLDLVVAEDGRVEAGWLQWPTDEEAVQEASALPADVLGWMNALPHVLPRGLSSIDFGTLDEYLNAESASDTVRHLLRARLFPSALVRTELLDGRKLARGGSGLSSLQSAPVATAVSVWLLTHGLEAAPWLGLAILAAGLVATLWPWRSALRLRGFRLAGGFSLLNPTVLLTPWPVVLDILYIRLGNIQHIGINRDRTHPPAPVGRRVRSAQLSQGGA
jgi:hypothetical protein